MPIYEYKCSKCEIIFEILKKTNEIAPQKCIKCGSPTQKLVSSSAFQFKGSGWYVTDYAKKDKEKKTPSKEIKAPKKDQSKSPPAKNKDKNEKK